MSRGEIIIGLATSFPNYGYVAVQPPLDEAQLPELDYHANDPHMQDKQREIALQITQHDNATEIECITPGHRMSSGELRSRIVTALHEVLQGSNRTVDVSEFIFDVSGADALFEQHARQLKDATVKS